MHWEDLICKRLHLVVLTMSIFNSYDTMFPGSPRTRICTTSMFVFGAWWNEAKAERGGQGTVCAIAVGSGLNHRGCELRCTSDY